MKRMMVYAWYDQDGNKGETKFGDHFVSNDVSMSEAVQHTIEYIKTAQFPRRSKHFASGRVQYYVWDVSEYAKVHNKFYPHSHVDDAIRPAIGFRGTVGVEFHTLPFDEVCIRVNKELARHNQPLPDVELSTSQYNTAVNALAAFRNGKRNIVAELCARFGKTIWSGVLAIELNQPLTVVASYVLTSFTSFIKDLSSFEQFSKLVLVDTKDEDYQDQINEALDAGKQVISFVSLCKGSKREKRVKFLFELSVDRLVIVDEADFGAHKAGQAELLKNNQKDNDIVVLMTGTNSDRAATMWDSDHFISVTYPELLMEKSLTLTGN